MHPSCSAQRIRNSVRHSQSNLDFLLWFTLCLFIIVIAAGLADLMCPRMTTHRKVGRNVWGSAWHYRWYPLCTVSCPNAM